MNTVLKGIMFGAALLAGAVLQAGAKTAKATVGTQSTGKADGVAIWIHPSDPGKSVILGSDTKKGLKVCDLKGELIELRNFANGMGKSGSAGVDVRYNFPLGGKKVDLIATGVGKQNTILFYTLDPKSRTLQDITGAPIKLDMNIYGICLYHSAKSGKFYAFATSREGLIEQWEVFDNGAGKVEGKLVRRFDIRTGGKEEWVPKIEVCLADDALGHVYISQEKECKIWRYGAEPDQGDKRILVDDASDNEEDNVEGLAIYPVGKTGGYLLASIQGSWKYKVYTREGYKYLGTFDVELADGSGKVESHDCIDICPLPLGPRFPNGLMVTQNGNNHCGDHFQLVPWEGIAELFKLKIDTSFDLRKQ